MEKMTIIFDKAYYIAEKITEELKSYNNKINIESKEYINLYKNEKDAKKLCNEKYFKVCKY